MASEARLEMMPKGVLRLICNFLPCDCSYLVLKRTCRRLNGLLRDHVTWSNDTLRMCSGVHVTVPLWVMAPTSNLTLSRLDLGSCSTATDVFLIDLGPLCPTIRDVSLEDCSLVTDVGLLGLCRCLRRLERLSIAGTKKISCESVADVMRMHASSIVNLNLSDAVGLRHDFYMLSFLLHHMLNLRVFTFKWSRNLISAPSSVQVSIGSFLQACPKLTHLSVAYLPLRGHVWTLHTLVKSCPSIRHLDLKYSCIKDENMILVCRELLFLEYLDVSGSDEISDVCLDAIGTNLLLLGFLNLSDCVNITDTGLRKALSTLCCLRDLLVRQCHHITDATFSSLRTMCPKLQFLDASGTMISASTLNMLQRFTDPEVVVVAKDCPHVPSLDSKCWGDLPQNIMNTQDRLQYARILRGSHRHESRSVNLDEFPDELLLQIFKYVPRDNSLVSVRATCRRFHQLAGDMVIWNNHYLVINDRLSTSLLKESIAKSSTIHTLDLNNCIQVSDGIVYHLATRWPKIKHITLTGCVLVTNKGLFALRECIEGLVSLSISHCKRITCYGLLEVLKKHNRTMRYLDISNCRGLLNDRFHAKEIARWSSNFTELYMEWSTDCGTRLLLGNDLSLIASRSPRLKTLNVSCLPTHGERFRVISLSCRNLEKLVAKRCFFTNETLEDLTTHLSNLRHLDLSGCSNLRENSYQTIHTHSKQLTYLNLSYCFSLSNHHCQQITLHLEQLRELILVDCHLLDDLGMQYVARHGRLSLLDLSGTAVTMRKLHEIHAIRQSMKLIRFIVKTRNCPFVVEHCKGKVQYD